MDLSFSSARERDPKTHAYSLDSTTAADFAAACDADGRSRSRVLEALMRAYIESITDRRQSV